PDMMGCQASSDFNLELVEAAERAAVLLDEKKDSKSAISLAVLTTAVITVLVSKEGKETLVEDKTVELLRVAFSVCRSVKSEVESMMANRDV
ncbi:MAG: hypothetical protein KGL35_10770, partial [Bradyrhizobium sp.]|nr:hypothetical protein [Bradyrhizobium sp.]